MVHEKASRFQVSLIRLLPRQTLQKLNCYYDLDSYNQLYPTGDKQALAYQCGAGTRSHMTHDITCKRSFILCSCWLVIMRLPISVNLLLYGLQSCRIIFKLYFLTNLCTATVFLSLYLTGICWRLAFLCALCCMKTYNYQGTLNTHRVLTPECILKVKLGSPSVLQSVCSAQ